MTSMDLPYDIERAHPTVQAHYRKLIADGQTSRFAEMVSLQIAPGTMGSDRAFMEGRYNNQQLDDLPKYQAQRLAREAREAGINISGKYYASGLADSRAWRDPEAWVSGTDDVLRVAKKRNKTVAGSVNYDAGPAPPPKRVPLSERIITEEIAREKRLNPGLKVTPELREKIIDRHAHPKLRGK